MLNNRQNKVAFFNMLSIVIMRGFSVITAPIFSRLLGTNGYGVTSNYSVWVGIVTIVFSLQTHGTLINAISEFPTEEQHKYRSSIMSLSMLFFVVCSIFVFVFIKPISEKLDMNWVLITLILFQSFGGFCLNFMNTKLTYEMRAGQNVLRSTIVSVGNLLLSIILVIVMPKSINYFGKVVGPAVSTGIMGIVFCVHTLKVGKTFYNKKYWAFCLSLVLPLVFYNLSSLLLGHIDILMVRWLCGTADSGIYGYAFNFCGILTTLFGALNKTWVPFFFEDCRNGDTEKIKKQAKNFLDVFTALSIGFLLLYKDVFSVYAREDFWGGMKTIPLFVACTYVNFLCTFPFNFEHYNKKMNVIATSTIVSSILNVILNVILIKRYGIVGAAVATFLSYFVQFLIHCIYVKKCMKNENYPFGMRIVGKYLTVFMLFAVIMIIGIDNTIANRVLSIVIAVISLYKMYKRKSII